MDYLECKEVVDSMEIFDTRLQHFYYDVIRKEVDIKIMWHRHCMRRALTEVVNAYKKQTVNMHKSDIKFDTSFKRCSYLMKHSPCFTSAVANYFLKLLIEQKNNIFEDAFDKGKVSVCCLGGGPATDAVAIIRIIRILHQPHWRQHQKVLNLAVNVVDLSEEWKETATNVLESLKENSDFFGTGEIKLTYEFHQTDLTQKKNDMKPEVISAISNANIVSLIYFISAVNGSKKKDKTVEMIENIMLQMKKKSLLFFLDSAADQHYVDLSGAAEKRNSMEEIYGPLVEEFHTLSVDSVKTFLDLYSEHFYRFMCMTNIFLCVSAWWKPEHKRITTKSRLRNVIKKERIPWRVPTEEESEYLTEEMIAYRKHVNRLLYDRFRFQFKRKEKYSHLKYEESKSAGIRNLGRTKTREPYYSKTEPQLRQNHPQSNQIHLNMESN